MEIIRLKRVSQEGKAVRGSMRVNGQDIATLENTDYIIPVGTYPVLVTFSPRFKRMLPLIGNVPERSGIRIHRGTKSEHSNGCVLVSARDKERIIKYITQNKANNEETVICISSAY